MMDPEWDDALAPRTLTRPAPLLADDELQTALARLDDVGGLVGHIPAEVMAWLVEVLCGRDAAAAVLAQRIAEVTR